MRRRAVVAAAALIAAFALVGLPVPVGSRQPAEIGDTAPAAFTTVIIPADAPAPGARGVSGDAPGLLAAAAADAPFVEDGTAPAAPAERPAIAQPDSRPGAAWKEPEQVLTGWASFYDNGTTAMRLPRGTLVRICGDGGCIVRRVTDYGPVARNGRIADLDRADFFRICGCGSWSGTTRITVSVY